ncbi:MAG: adenylate kinase [bacterium]|nr:adenylate kinase [bacterium]
MRLVLLGPPGAGKGTLSEALVSHFSCAHISTGDIFRAHQQKNTEFGKLIASYIDKGLFVPDDIVLQIIAEHLRIEVGEQGFIFDGFPRDIPQAEALEKLLAELHIKLDAVINLDVAVDMLVQRLVQRRVCPKCKAVYHLINRPPQKPELCDFDGEPLQHRHDDYEEVIVQRMEQYTQKTAPLIDFYKKRGLLITVSGADTPDNVSSQVITSLEALAKL